MNRIGLKQQIKIFMSNLTLFLFSCNYIFKIHKLSYSFYDFVQ